MKNYSVLILLIFVLIGCDESENPKNWQLVWEDNFDGLNGTSPDPLKWTYDIGTGINGWGNQQLEYNTDRPENVSHDGEGNLVITAIEARFESSDYSSARITTRGLFEVMHGRIEARIKLPWGQGIWPALWLLGSNIEEIGWPQCGEIDIMEYRGQNPSTILGSVHGPGYSAGNSVSDEFSLFNDRFDTDFHVFAIEWDENEIKYFVDGQNYFTVTPEDVMGEWVFDNNFNIILNLAVGGTFVGPTNEKTVFPQMLYVDYIKVYK
ncbi:glycoside hydrolase family 16 protein [Candidatus Kapabacteria bacterium]|nr:glycoside hydrolase family 16 protein [Candidatus Kapabacteria bacterium]